MLNREEVLKRMEERGFTVYSKTGDNIIQFISSHIYNINYKEVTPKKEQQEVILIVVDLEKDNFSCKYVGNNTFNFLATPTCGSILNDEHFDNIVGIFESQAKWMAKIL